MSGRPPNKSGKEFNAAELARKTLISMGLVNDTKSLKPKISLKNAKRTRNAKIAVVPAEVPVEIPAEVPAAVPAAVTAEVPVAVTSAVQIRKASDASDAITTPSDCTTLYDPCDPSKQLESIAALEKRVREIRQTHMQLTDERTELPVEIKTRFDLLLFILNNPTPPDSSLLQFKRGEQTGQIYEAYWDIAFALGLVDKYEPTKEYYMYNGSIDNIRSMDDTALMANPLQYLEQRAVNMGASGASDITAVYKDMSETHIADPCAYSQVAQLKKPKFIFCSSKLYNDDSKKSIDKFDIQNIYTAAKHLNVDYDYEIVLLVRNKTAVKNKIRTALRKYISEETSAVYGFDDLLIALRKIYDLSKQFYGQTIITKDNIYHMLKLDKPIKPILSLRLHQHISANAITDAVNKYKSAPNENNKFIVGILPRGGKTYIAGGIVRNLKPKRVVVLLGALSETLDQFKKDMYEYFQDFVNYKVIYVRDDNIDSETIDPRGNYIFIMSVELFKTTHSSRPLLRALKDDPTKRADLFICDEGHLKQVTQRTEDEIRRGTDVDENAYRELDTTLPARTPVIYLTGTYMRPYQAFKIPLSNIVIWDYQDLQAGKLLADDDSHYKNMFGYYYTHALQALIDNGETRETIAEKYKKFPDLHLITTQFSDAARRAFSDQGTELGFSTIGQLFTLKAGFEPSVVEPQLWADGFSNLPGLMRLINYLAPPGVTAPDSDEIGSALKSIDKIAQRMGDRLAHISTSFIVHSQIWFLPRATGSLKNRIPALASAIFRNKWFRRNFVVLAVFGESGKVRSERVDIPSDDGSVGKLIYLKEESRETTKSAIIRYENEARQQGKGVIILAQQMLQVGISLPCVDIVVLLDTGENIDERVQKMFRALTESPNKKAGFIIDMNYFRTVKAILDYQITAFRVKARRTVLTNKDRVDQINKFFELYYIDDDKPVFEADLQRSIPEIQSLIEREGIGGLKLEDAGKKINQNVINALGNEYNSNFNSYLQSLEVALPVKHNMRKEGEGVNPAVAEDNDENEGAVIEKPIQIPKIFGDDMQTSASRREAFLEIFRTILKMGVFSSSDESINELLNSLTNDPHYRDIIFDTLIQRGIIANPHKRTALEIFIDKDKAKTKMKIGPGGKEKTESVSEIKKIKKDISDKIKKVLANSSGRTKSNVLDGICERERTLCKIFNTPSSYSILQAYMKNIISGANNHNGNNNDEDNEVIESDIETIIGTQLFNTLPEAERTRFENDAINEEQIYEKYKNTIFEEIIIPNIEQLISKDKTESYTVMKRQYNTEIHDVGANVLKYIHEHLTPKESEKHKYGEVFTRLELVDEMLSKLPSEVWSNKDFKWLDPANGIGNFPIKAFLGQSEGKHTYPGLMKGLEGVIPDESKRCKHIIENMLYMIDINAKNNAIARKLFASLCPGATPNIEQIDRKNGFLTSKPLMFNGKQVSEFDIVIGNPPFNRGAIRVAMVTNKTEKAKREAVGDEKGEAGFWIKFVDKILNKGILARNGHLLFIHPITWFKPDMAGAHDMILSKQINILKIYKNDEHAKSLFEGSGKISVAYYHLINTPPTQPTHILYGSDDTKKDTLKLSTDSIILLDHNTIYNKILNACPLFKGSPDLKKKTLKSCNDNGDHKLIVDISEDRRQNKYTMAYIMSSVEHEDQSKPKLIVGGTYTPIVLYDKDGEYGLYAKGQRNYFIGEGLDKIREFFKTKLSTLLLQDCKFEQDFIKPEYYPDVRRIALDSITDESLAEFFKFTAGERAEIEKMDAPQHIDSAKMIKKSCKDLNKKAATVGGSHKTHKYTRRQGRK